MEAHPITRGIGPFGRGYLYWEDVLIGPVEDARWTALPDDPQPGTAAGFVEVAMKLGTLQWARLDGLDSPIANVARWGLKIAGLQSATFPEFVIKRGTGMRAADGYLLVRSEWDSVDESGPPWWIASASPAPDLRELR